MTDDPSTPHPETVKQATLALLAARRAGSSICPSEVARYLRPEPGEGWRELMPLVRDVAGVLAKSGKIEATQRGSVVNPILAKGPIRLRVPQ